MGAHGYYFNWQRELAIHLGSYYHVESSRKQSRVFCTVQGYDSDADQCVTVRVEAVYGNPHSNGGYNLRVGIRVHGDGCGWYRALPKRIRLEQGGKEHLDDAMFSIADLLPYHDWYTFGPWGYFSDLIYHAGNRDCHGLTKMQHKQLLAGGDKNRPCWRLVAIDPDGVEMPVWAVEHAVRTVEGPKPIRDWRLEWRPWWVVGEGKERDLDHVRRAANWPDATDEQLCAEPDKLALALAERLPGQLALMRKAVERVGFTW